MNYIQQQENEKADFDGSHELLKLMDFMMKKRKSIYERLSLKQKVEMARKSQAMRTLREELERTNKIQTQLSAIVDDTAIKPGATTAMQIRSSSWYTERASMSN